MGVGTTRGWVTVIKLSRITTLSLSGIAVMNAVPRDTTRTIVRIRSFQPSFFDAPRCAIIYS